MIEKYYYNIIIVSLILSTVSNNAIFSQFYHGDDTADPATPLFLDDQIDQYHLISQNQTWIIDLNRTTNYPHQNITIFGDSRSINTGRAVAAGDINGDGYEDIIISTKSKGPINNRVDCGAVKVILGNSTHAPLYYIDSAADIIIYGVEDYDNIGNVLETGDINNDGYDDIIISTIYGDGEKNTRLDCGEIYVIYGNSTLPSVWDLNKTNSDIYIQGAESNDKIGQALACGDINGDNYDDIAIGAKWADGPSNSRTYCGEVYIIYGNTSVKSSIDLKNDANITIFGIDSLDYMGDALAFGDLNSDKYDDVIIGAPGGNGYKNSKNFCGETYVIFGNDTNILLTSIDLSSKKANITIYGNNNWEYFGRVITSGDLNGDDFDDIIVSAKVSKTGKPYCGEVYIFYGNSSMDTNFTALDSNVSIIGENLNDDIGQSLDMGNINNDNFTDLLIGAPAAKNDNRSGAGEGYAFFGNTTLPSTIDLESYQPNFLIFCWEYDLTGDSVLIADINGDDFGELLLTSPNGDGRNNDKSNYGEIDIIMIKGEVLPIPIIDTVGLINGYGNEKKICFAGFDSSFIFRTQITSPVDVNDIKSVTLALAYNEPMQNIQCTWTRSTGKFEETRDPNDLIVINAKSEAIIKNARSLIVRFFIDFNITYPDNDFHSLQIHTVSDTNYQDWLNLTSEIYMVENRFDLLGNLTVKSQHRGLLSERDWVAGGDILNFSGLKVVYYDTLNMFPVSDLGINISVTDSVGNNNSWMSRKGKEFFIELEVRKTTINNEIYEVYIDNIRPNSDMSNINFKLNIDSDQPIFSNPVPDNKQWLGKLNPECKIRISDNSTGINGSSIQYRTSINNGDNWIEWSSTGIKTKSIDDKTIECSVNPTLANGEHNLIQWRARDILDNPLTESLMQQIKIDVMNVIFKNATPTVDILNDNVSVICGITIIDEQSGVNASSIDFSTSTTGIWGYGEWQSANKIENNNIINCTVTPTFTEGTDNYIRWRAKDVAGNGYHVSDNYQIKIKLNKPPTTTLISPKNRSIIYTLTPELVWSTNDPDNDTALSHSIYLSTDKNQIIDLNKSALLKSNIVNQFFELDTQLEDNTTYYWTIIPFDGRTIGYCTSNFWEFIIQTTVTIPTCTLIEPLNNTNISSTTPKLSWILNYFNSSIVTYNIYLAKAPVVGELISEKYLYQEDYKLTTFIVEKPLIRGETYYWTVIPIADHPSGKLEGICQSGKWKFKIELPVEHFYNISMEIELINLTVEQGGIITTNITITNLGDSSDTFFLEINKGTLNANIAFEDSINKINLLKDEQKKITLEIIVSPITTPKNYTIQITAESEKAKLDGNDVSVTKSIRLKVLEKPPEDLSKDDSEKQFGFWDMIMWLVIILTIFILLVISIFVYKAKKEKEIPTVKAELMYKPPPHLALPEGEVKGEEDMLLPGADEVIVPTLGAPGVSTRYQLPKAVLTKKQELKLLREKFLLGEIDKETYKEMKNDIENTEDISAEDQDLEEMDLDLKGKLPGQTEDIGLEDNEDIEGIDQEDLSSEIEDLETMEHEELEKTTEIPVEDSVIDNDFQDIPEEVYPFPYDGFCITCGQSMDPDMAYCWSCGTKYETLEE